MRTTKALDRLRVVAPTCKVGRSKEQWYHPLRLSRGAVRVGRTNNLSGALVTVRDFCFCFSPHQELMTTTPSTPVPTGTPTQSPCPEGAVLCVVGCSWSVCPSICTIETANPTEHLFGHLGVTRARHPHNVRQNDGARRFNATEICHY